MPVRHLMLFGKLPEPGRVKTRLAAGLGEEAAARLYLAFLDDMAALVAGAGVEVRELWVPPRPEAERRLAPRYPGLRLRWQRGGGLGERMAAAFGEAFASGADRALLLGSDHPTLPAAALEAALALLERTPVVLGPSEDGGYWGVGIARAAWPFAEVLFEGIPWSTPSVLEVTRRRARRAGLEWVEAGDWYDVDEPADLARLRRDVGRNSRTARVLERLAPASP